MPKFSVIVPVYNTEKYVLRCLKSLQCQSLKDFEAIVVDDGSTDGSASIIQEFIKSDSRFTYIRKEHSNAGDSRNVGLAKASGEFLLFLDSDDFVKPNLLKQACRCITKYDADICVYRSSFFFEETGKKKKNSFLHFPILLGYHDSKIKNGILKKVVTGLKYLVSFIKPVCMEDLKSYKYVFNFIEPCPWNKVYRRQFFVDNDLQFQSISRTNDLWCVFSALAFSKRIVCLNRVLHYYSKNDSSLQDTKYKSPMDCFIAMAELKRTLVDSGLFECCQRSYCNFLLNMVIRELNYYQDKPNVEEVYAAIKEKVLPENQMFMKQEEYFYGFNKDRFKKLKLIQELSCSEYYKRLQ